MIDKDKLFRQLHMEPEMVCTFLAVFSRMEYALKSTRFASGDERSVKPAWDAFANEVNEQFLRLDNQQLVDARNYLMTHPPRKQILVGHRVRFEEQNIDKKQAETQQILLMVRTVRNNLFHGGKYLPNGEQEVNRNQLLIQHSLTVLIACLELNQEVRNSFQF